MTDLTHGNSLPANTDAAIVLGYHVDGAVIDVERLYNGSIVYLTPSAINVNVSVNPSPESNPQIGVRVNEPIATESEPEPENGECCKESLKHCIATSCALIILMVVVIGGITWGIIYAKNETAKN